MSLECHDGGLTLSRKVGMQIRCLAWFVGHAEGMWGQALFDAVSKFCAEGAPGYLCAPLNPVVSRPTPIAFFVNVCWWLIKPGVVDGGKVLFYVA
jgi:hypothetical protein